MKLLIYFHHLKLRYSTYFITVLYLTLTAFDELVTLLTAFTTNINAGLMAKRCERAHGIEPRDITVTVEILG